MYIFSIALLHLNKIIKKYLRNLLRSLCFLNTNQSDLA